MKHMAFNHVRRESSLVRERVFFPTVSSWSLYSTFPGPWIEAGVRAMWREEDQRIDKIT